MGRSPCCDKTKVKRGPWSPEEDSTLKNYVEKYGTGGNWIALPHKAGLKRCGKSCRLRWLNYLRPNIKHGGFTKEEDDIILTLYHNIGSRWSVIASRLPGRTDNDVKNYWNTKLKKKLLAAQTTATAAAANSDTSNLTALARTSSEASVSTSNYSENWYEIVNPHHCPEVVDSQTLQVEEGDGVPVPLSIENPWSYSNYCKFPVISAEEVSGQLSPSVFEDMDAINLSPSMWSNGPGEDYTFPVDFGPGLLSYDDHLLNAYL